MKPGLLPALLLLLAQAAAGQEKTIPGWSSRCAGKGKIPSHIWVFNKPCRTCSGRIIMTDEAGAAPDIPPLNDVQ